MPKQSLKQADDLRLAKRLLKAASVGELDLVRHLIEVEGAETGLLKSDAGFDNYTHADVLALDIFRLSNLADEGDVLNAALYWAVFHGHEAVADYLLQRGDVDQKTLDIALFAAVRSQSLHMVNQLLDLGADASFESHAAIEQSYLRGRNTEITDRLMEASGDYAYVMSLHIRSGKLDKVADCLTHQPDTKPAIAAAIRQLSDRTRFISDGDETKYMDMLDMLMSYEEARGSDMHALISFAMSHAVDMWSSKALEQLVDHPQFDSHPQRADLLVDALRRAVRLTNAYYDLSREGQEAVARKVFEKGASPDLLLVEALEVENRNLVACALENGADPRRGKPSLLKMFAERKADSPVVHKQEIYHLLQTTAENLSALEKAHYLSKTGESRPTPDQLLQTEAETGKTYLQLSIPAGLAGDALTGLAMRKEGFVDALYKPDAHGDHFVDWMIWTDQAHFLFDPQLWQGRAEEFSRFCDDFPLRAVGEHKAEIAHVSSMLAAEKSSAALKTGLGSQKGRFKLK